MVSIVLNRILTSPTQVSESCLPTVKTYPGVL
jgi:hypothetical protein